MKNVDGQVTGIIMADGKRFDCKVILTTGQPFLSGVLHKVYKSEWWTRR